MTPTDEEAELARVIRETAPACHICRTTTAEHDLLCSAGGDPTDEIVRRIVAAGYVKRNDATTDSLPYYPEKKPDLKFSITLTPEQAEAFYAAGGQTVVGQTFTATGDPASIRNDALEEAAKVADDYSASAAARIRALKAKG